MSTFFPRSPAIDSAVNTSSSASFVLVERLASLLFFSSGEKASEEEDLGRSFLFGGIELQRITRQKAEHRRHVLTPRPFSALYKQNVKFSLNLTLTHYWIKDYILFLRAAIHSWQITIETTAVSRRLTTNILLYRNCKELLNSTFR